MPTTPQYGSSYSGLVPITQAPPSSKQANPDVLQCNIAVNIKNTGEMTSENVNEHMAFLGSVLESYECLIAGRIGNYNMTKEDYDQIDPEEMEMIDICWCMASVI